MDAMTKKELRKRYLDSTDKEGNMRYDLQIPEIGDRNILEFLEDLPNKERHEMKQRIITKALSDLSDTNKEAITNQDLRTDIAVKTTKKMGTRCTVCNSMYYSAYLEWKTMDNWTYAELSRMSFILGDEISDKSFSNHFTKHAFEKNFVRRMMVLTNPTIDAEKTARGMLQLLTEDAMQDDEINPKKAKMIKEYIKILDKIEGRKIPKTPIVDASQINITQVNVENNNGSIPASKDTKALLETTLTDEERTRLRELQEKWKGKGTSKVREGIPRETPVVKQSKEAIEVDFLEE